MALSIVATPIGNLEDITLRAVRTLREADVIACENIPRTRALLAHLDIRKKALIEYSPANERNSAKGIVLLLQEGKNVALVSDAGTPGVSDPGLAVVSAAAEAGEKITPIPGASALTALASVCGLGGEALIFLGFLPKKEGPALGLLQRYAAKDNVLLIYESGRRLKKLLNLLKSCPVSADITIGKELTKLHEALMRGTAQQLEALVTETEKGEFALALRFAGAFEQPAKEKPFSKKEKRQQKLKERNDREKEPV